MLSSVEWVSYQEKDGGRTRVRRSSTGAWMKEQHLVLSAFIALLVQFIVVY
jgi:hypothetical protein